MISEITARSIQVSGQIASHSWPQNASDAASSSSCATGRRTTRAPRCEAAGCRSSPSRHDRFAVFVKEGHLAHLHIVSRMGGRREGTAARTADRGDG
jgi:hypothetical protein